jgi:hypothetical protein
MTKHFLVIILLGNFLLKLKTTIEFTSIEFYSRKLKYCNKIP